MKVTVTAPGNWQPTKNGLAIKDDLGFSMEGIGFDVGCDGECSADKVPAAMKNIVEKSPEAASKPNYNTGDAALDAVRLDVTTLTKGSLPDGGVFVEYSVKKPAHLDPKVDGPYPLRVKACVRASRPPRITT